MICACGRGAPGWKPDPGVCPNGDDHGPAGGHCACCHEPDSDADRDAVRDQLAAALVESNMLHRSDPFRWDFADALLPVVDRIANERAAAELEAVAAEMAPGLGDTEPPKHYWPLADWIRTRAAALRASNGEGTTT